MDKPNCRALTPEEIATREEYAQELDKQHEFAKKIRLQTEDILRQWIKLANWGPHETHAFAALATLWFQHARNYGEMSGEQEDGR